MLYLHTHRYRSFSLKDINHEEHPDFKPRRTRRARRFFKILSSCSSCSALKTNSLLRKIIPALPIESSKKSNKTQAASKLCCFRQLLYSYFQTECTKLLEQVFTAFVYLLLIKIISTQIRVTLLSIQNMVNND